MNCERFERELALLSVVSRSEDLDAELSAHAKDCARCGGSLRERIALDRVLAIDGDEPPPAGIAAGARNRMKDDREAIPSLEGARASRRPVAIAAAAAALFLVVWALHREDRGPVGPDPLGPDAEMLAQLDLLLDWEVLDDHGSDLDLISADELLAAVESGDEG